MIQQRILAGWELLDNKVPGWRDKINKDKLRMDDERNCLLGQLFGTFRKGLAALGLDIGKPCAHLYGFTAQQDVADFSTGKRKERWLVTFEDLDKGWKEILSVPEKA